MQVVVSENSVRPFIRFEQRSVQDRNASEDAGHPVYVNVDFVILMQKGSKDEYVKQADEWFAQKKRESATGVYNPQWLEAFKNAYDGWKKGQEIPADGMPLTMWPGRIFGRMLRFTKLGERIFMRYGTPPPLL